MRLSLRSSRPTGAPGRARRAGVALWPACRAGVKGEEMRALVVDDSRAMRDLIRDLLNRARFQVLIASGADEALQVLDGIGPMDLALINWGLPGRGALRFVRSVRACREFDPMKLIMMTSGIDADEVIEAMRAGVDECLVKPFTRNMLLEKIASLRLC